MQYSSLSELIDCLEFNSELHICVEVISKTTNQYLQLPHDKFVHNKFVCNKFKTIDFEKCFNCRTQAINKALATKEGFERVCVNGVYEYVKPVFYEDKPFCIIFIGNVYKKNEKVLDEELVSTMQPYLSREFYQTLANVLESYIVMILETTPSAIPNVNVTIERIVEYITNNLQYDLKITHVANTFHYNEKYVGRLFKNQVGKKFNDFVNDIRLKKAKHLLLNTNLSIIEIANSVGFNNVTYFNKLFKQVYNATPSNIRKKEL